MKTTDCLMFTFPDEFDGLIQDERGNRRLSANALYAFGQVGIFYAVSFQLPACNADCLLNKDQRTEHG